MDVDPLWEYDDPVKSEAVFRAAMADAAGDDRLELLTQVARALGLQEDYEGAHRMLDQAEEAMVAAGRRPAIRYQLERGRVFNSSGEKDQARTHFQTAWEAARAAGEEGLAVDAAHMMAITHAGTAEAEPWTQRALGLARGSKDPKAVSLLPAILNNHAWDLHDLGRFDEALPAFEQALEAWTARDQALQIHVARWSVAHCLRSLGRHSEALAILKDLVAEGAADQAPDPFVFDELAENLAAIGDETGAERARHQADALREADQP